MHTQSIHASAEPSSLRTWTGRAILIAGALLFVTTIVLAFLAYFVTSGTNAGPIDGLGRALHPTPALVRFLGADRMWPGALWFLVDFAVFWGGTFGAFYIAIIGFRLADRR